MDILYSVNKLIGTVFFICYLYQFIYIIISLFLKPKKTKSEISDNSIAVLICARNEERVIGDLIESLYMQNYNQALIHIFVMADNCTDRTAEIARNMGASVYFRNSKTEIGKGYALTELLRRIHTDYPEGFDGYLVLDADNILGEDYIFQMNRCLSSGADIITGYRNSKNFGNNWISEGSSVMFLRESRLLNGARNIIGSSSTVSGTGFMFSRNILNEMGEWSYHTLTEDLEFTVDMVTKGKKIAYCPDAILYDEQPIKFSQSWHQRVRWAKGYIQVLKKYGIKLLKGICKGDFSCYDIFMSIFPAYLLSSISVFANAVCFVLELCLGEPIIDLIASVIHISIKGYLLLFIIGAITVLAERKHIKESICIVIESIFVFPVFMFTFIPVSVCALFSKPEWKPIEHTVTNKNTP